MSPEEWNTGVNNEADHVPDQTWASEAREYVRRQAWRRNLAGVGLGIVVIQAVVLLQVLKAPLMVQLAVAGQNGGLWTNLTDVPLLIMALLMAWTLGRRGQRAWSVALGFLLFPVVKIWTELVLLPAYNLGLSPTFGLVFEGKTNPLTLESVLLWEGLALLGFLAATLGARMPRQSASV